MDGHSYWLVYLRNVVFLLTWATTIIGGPLAYLLIRLGRSRRHLRPVVLYVLAVPTVLWGVTGLLMLLTRDSKGAITFLVGDLFLLGSTLRFWLDKDWAERVFERGRW